MKKTSALLAFLALFFASGAFANKGIVTSVTGTASVSSATAPARVLRQGDEVQQGATVSTGVASSLVIRFEDGQVAALASNSRMTITEYRYDAQRRTGNVLLSLVNGGMRAITGFIGRNQPQQVAYRAATATIGIRGTDVSIVTILGNVVVTVTDGEISFRIGERIISVKAGEGVSAKTDGTFQKDAAERIVNQLSAELAAAIKGVQGLEAAINRAAGRKPDDKPPVDAPPSPPGPPVGTPGPANPPGGGGGGGPPSRR